MSNDTVIKVDNLGKQYRIGAHEGYKTFRETSFESGKTPFQHPSSVFDRTNKTNATNKTVSSN